MPPADSLIIGGFLVGLAAAVLVGAIIFIPELVKMVKWRRSQRQLFENLPTDQKERTAALIRRSLDLQKQLLADYGQLASRERLAAAFGPNKDEAARILEILISETHDSKAALQELTIKLS